MPSSNRLWGVLAAGLLSVWCGPALADPLFEDELPKTFAEGFIQGVGLPVIGLYHLAAMIGIGIP